MRCRKSLDLFRKIFWTKKETPPSKSFKFPNRFWSHVIGRHMLSLSTRDQKCTLLACDQIWLIFIVFGANFRGYLAFGKNYPSLAKFLLLGNFFAVNDQILKRIFLTICHTVCLGRGFDTDGRLSGCFRHHRYLLSSLLYA